MHTPSNQAPPPVQSLKVGDMLRTDKGYFLLVTANLMNTNSIIQLQSRVWVYVFSPASNWTTSMWTAIRETTIDSNGDFEHPANLTDFGPIQWDYISSLNFQYMGTTQGTPQGVQGDSASPSETHEAQPDNKLAYNPTEDYNDKYSDEW